MLHDSNISKGKFLSKDWFCLMIVLLTVIAFIAPIPYMGIPDGDQDFPQHLQFAATYSDTISAGDFLPVWAASDNYGFGSVGTRFYPPIAAFSLGFVKILTGNWFDAIWTSLFFWMFASCAGIYFWSREWLAPQYATVAAALYVIIPYHLLQIYQMWLYAEFVAAAILPFCFWFITRICRQGRPIDVLLFVVSFSLLLLSHIPTTITGSLSLAVYGLLLVDWSQYRKTFIKLFVAFGLSLSATAFYWVKVVTEIDWVKANDSQYSTGSYDPQKNLFPLILSTGEKYITRGLWHFDVTFILTILFFLFAIVYLGWQIKNIERQERKNYFALSITGLFAAFMMSLPSFFIWQSISILQKIQFPWRWLSVLSIISVVIFASVVPLITSQTKTIKKLLAYTILFIVFSILLFDVTQSIIQSEPVPRIAFETKLPEIFGEPGCECWWTSWSKKQAFERREKVFAESRNVNITTWEATKREFTIEAGEPTNVRVATFYYPYWQAQINGQIVQIQKDNDGSILIPVNGENSSVKLYFQEPQFLKFASLMSFLTWLLLLGATVLAYRNKEANPLNCDNKLV